MRISIVGVGNVGKALGEYLSTNHEVSGVDIKDIHTSFKVDRDYSSIKDAELIFIALPTSFNEDNKSLDTTSVANGVKEVMKINKDAPIFIKSTVNIGFTRKLIKEVNKDNIYYTPEFLRQSHALEDITHPDRLVIGTLKHDQNIDLYFSLFNSEKNFEMSLEEAEATKLFANTYLATRIAFFNELDSYCEINELDSSKIIKAVSSDKRIGDYYNKPSYGYGGYCLPKDTKELAKLYNVPQKIIEATVLANDVRKDHIVSQVLAKLEGEDEPLVGIYGLPKKYSPLEDIIAKLKAKNVPLIIYSQDENVKEYNSVEVTNNFARIVVDSVVILSEENLPEDFKELDKFYVK